MADLQEAEPIVTEGIREQAANLGYIVKQKGRLEKQPLSTVWHEIVSPGDPWQITSNSASGSFSRSRPFRSRTFATEAEALASLPEVLRDDARFQALDKYGVRITPWDDSRHFGLGSDELPNLPVGPYDSVGAALDVAEQAAKEYDEANERRRLNRLESRLAEHERNLPSEFHGIDLENFKAKTETVKDALEVAWQYVSIFPTHNTKCLVLCGERGTSKTRLAVAIAASLTVHDRAGAIGEHDLQCHYKTVAEVIADDSGLCEPGLLLLDWCEVQAPDTKSHGFMDLVGALSGRAVANLLELRYAQNLATLLIADCDQTRLRRYLGPSAFAKLQQKSWEIVELEKGKEAQR